jgi:hypothetical protein
VVKFGFFNHKGHKGFHKGHKGLCASVSGVNLPTESFFLHDRVEQLATFARVRLSLKRNARGLSFAFRADEPESSGRSFRDAEGRTGVGDEGEFVAAVAAGTKDGAAGSAARAALA